MSDPRNELKGRFNGSDRFRTFGECIVSIQIQGVRCHKKTPIEIRSPITAFCGLNGTGKSTFLQIAACAYINPKGASETYYVSDFFVVGKLDKKPFADTSSVQFEYCQEKPQPKVLTLSRTFLRPKWEGYKRRPKREVFFAGMGLYLPKVERRDFAVRNARDLNVTKTQPLSDSAKRWVCQILGCGYEAVNTNTVSHGKHVGDVVTVQRGTAEYSEVHMGCGEGRVQHIVRYLEALPEQSLVLLEEPETSLHPSAQFEFGKYLVNTCLQRKHQILLTTHSEELLKALPSESRVFLQRTASMDIIPLPGLSAAQAKSLMSDGHAAAVHVLVEDLVAQAILRAILRKTDPRFLSAVQIIVAGCKDDIGITARSLSKTGLHVAAVRDGDTGGNPKENIYSLPALNAEKTDRAPEKELFSNKLVQAAMQEKYGLSLVDFATGLNGVDHHEWWTRIATAVNQDETVLISEMAIEYVKSLPEIEIDSLVKGLKQTTEK